MKTDESTHSNETESPDERTVWLVSFADEDDRELAPPEIAEALRRGEINGETIVWRDGLADWVALASIPSLAKLLVSTGETANAPLVIPKREHATAPATGSKLSAPPKREAKPDAAAKPRPSPPTPPTRPVAPGARPPPAWKGTTRVGLPRVEPKRMETPTVPKAASAPKPAPRPPSPRSATATPRPLTPSGAKATPDDAVTAPLAPKVETAVGATPARDDAVTVPLPANAPVAKIEKTPTPTKAAAAETPATRAAASAINVFGDPEELEPISVDPESIRPMMPAQRLSAATALSAGTLGMPRKPPAAPRPPGAKGPATPAAELPSEPGTPALAALTTVAIGKNAGVDEDILNLAGGGLPGAIVAAPADMMNTLTAATPSTAPAAAVETPSEPKPKPKRASDVAAPKQPEGATPSAAPPAGEKKRSLLPFVLAGGAAVLVLAVALRGPGADKAVPEEPKAVPQAEPGRIEPPAAVAEPPPAPPAPVEATPPPEPGKAPPTEPSPPTEVAPKQASRAAGNAPVTEPATLSAPRSEKTPAADKPAAAPAAEAKEPPKATTEPSPPEADVGGEFDKASATAALGSAAGEASSCRKEGDPSGVAVVRVTFSNAGRATRATLEGPPFAGTATGSCIAAAMRKASVPPYGGDRVTVTKRVVIR